MHLCTFLDWKELFSLYSRHPSAWFHHLGEKEGPTCGAVEEAGMEGLWHQRQDRCEHAVLKEPLHTSTALP